MFLSSPDSDQHSELSFSHALAQPHSNLSLENFLETYFLCRVCLTLFEFLFILRFLAYQLWQSFLWPKVEVKAWDPLTEYPSLTVPGYFTIHLFHIRLQASKWQRSRTKNIFFPIICQTHSKMCSINSCLEKVKKWTTTLHVTLWYLAKETRTMAITKFCQYLL